MNVRHREVFTIKCPVRRGFVMGIWPLFYTFLKNVSRDTRPCIEVFTIKHVRCKEVSLYSKMKHACSEIRKLQLQQFCFEMN